jgi:hypothetical protein
MNQNFNMTTFLLVLFLVGLVMVLLAVTILFKKNGKFPDTHIEGNPHLKKQGITCASHDEYECAMNTSHEKSACESCCISSCTLQNL